MIQRCYRLFEEVRSKLFDLSRSPGSAGALLILRKTATFDVAHRQITLKTLELYAVKRSSALYGFRAYVDRSSVVSKREHIDF
jgi:hypothetical protein